MSGFAVLGSILFVHALVSRRLERTVLTAPMLYTLAGLLFGPLALGLVHLELGSHDFLLLGEIALVLLLFVDAARVDVRARGTHARLPVRLLGIGMPLTIILGTVVGMVVLGALSFQEAALLATILAPTDAALGQAVVGNPRVPARIRQALNVEAGLNDGMSMPFLAVFLTLAEAEVQAQPFRVWLAAAGAQIGFGVLVGMIVGLGGGWLVHEARRPRWMTGTFMRLGLLALAIIAWLGLIVVLDGPTLPGRGLIVAVVVTTVLLSILAHGVTSVPLSRRYARLARALPEDAPEKRGAADVPTRLGHVEPLAAAAAS